MRVVETFCWSFPGIIKHYEYYMIPYLIAEYPEMDSSEAFRLSREMMEGNKLDTFILELSFLGWYLLGLLACGVGMIFVDPYREAALGELYLACGRKAGDSQEQTPYARQGRGGVYPVHGIRGRNYQLCGMADRNCQLCGARGRNDQLRGITDKNYPY